MMDAIRILIADDQAITRNGLRALLASAPGIEVVGEAANGAKAIELAVTLDPDVILMDLMMPVINGIEATRRIHRTSPHIAILVVTIFEDDISVFPAIRAGASGYLLKDADQAELLRAIETVAIGGVIFSPGIARRVLQYLAELPSNAPSQAFDELTPREHEILELIAHGYNNMEIAERLVLSPKTVSNHVSNVLIKLQATDRTKLMLLALEAGLGQKDKAHESQP
ncbi:MAG TPA: response regulator transcription factor [Ktedonobacteraceae bacterium]|nr:response regulator transcription factor [Ktedonobacteraceae bacterium]